MGGGELGPRDQDGNKEGPASSVKIRRELRRKRGGGGTEKKGTSKKLECLIANKPVLIMVKEGRDDPTENREEGGVPFQGTISKKQED